MPSGVIHEPKNGLAALWRRYKAILFGASEPPDGKTPCPWCEGAGMLYDGKSGLLVYCDCCNRTGFIPEVPAVPPLARFTSSRQH
jgi:hypothetical protein